MYKGRESGHVIAKHVSEGNAATKMMIGEKDCWCRWIEEGEKGKAGKEKKEWLVMRYL